MPREPLRKREGPERTPGSQKTCLTAPSDVPLAGGGWRRRRLKCFPIPGSHWAGDFYFMAGKALLESRHRAVVATASLLVAGVLSLAPVVGAGVSSTEAALRSAPKDYHRIITFSPAITEIIYKLGAEDRLVGVAAYSDYPPEAKKKPTVGGILNIDSEQIIALSPDLILSPPGAVASERLPRFGADAIFVPDDTLSDIEKSFSRVGETVGKAEDGRALAGRLRDAVEAARKRSARLPRVKTLVVIGYEPMWVAGGTGAVDEILKAVGGENVAGGVKKSFYAPSFEQVLASGPQVIVDLTLDAPDTNERREAVKAFWKRFGTIPAVANGRIEFLDSDLLTIPGPRIVDGVPALERALRGSAAQGGADGPE